MEVKLIKSPKKDKKFRVIFPDERKVDFGAFGYSDFTKHRNPERMRRYVERHGGKIKKSIMSLTDPEKIIKEMLSVDKSVKENWSKKGMYTPGFWSRWYLWSFPFEKDIKKLLKKKFGIILRS